MFLPSPCSMFQHQNDVNFCLSPPMFRFQEVEVSRGSGRLGKLGVGGACNETKGAAHEGF